MPSLALSILTKNEEANIGKFLDLHSRHFDKVYVLDTGSTDKTVEIAKEHGAQVDRATFDIKPTKKQLQKMQEMDPSIPDDITIFDFSAARNHAFSLIKEDYVVWLDADDTVDLGDLPYKDIFQSVDPQFDGFFWAYNYATNNQGESEAMHWRERLIRLKPFNLTWKGLVHETLIPKVQGQEAVWCDDNSVQVVHHKTLDEHEGSHTRNHTTLLYEYARDGDETDPRTLQYLGMSFIKLKDFRHAIFFLTRHIEKTGWDEDKYRSWRHISECYRQMGDIEWAMSCNQQALNVKGEFFNGTKWPDAWYGLAECHLTLGNYEMCLDYIEIGLTKSPPDTLSVVDPTLYTYKPIAMAMKAYMGLLDIPKAYKAALKLKELAPEYEMTREYYPLLRDSFYEGEYIKNLKWLLEYLKTHDQAKIDPLLRSIPAALQFDPRIAKLKDGFIAPRTHAANEITFLCGGVEKWTPKNVEQGIGGSEEAIIYLTKELAKQGWKPTVYNTCAEDAGDYEGVTYKDSSEFNPNDQFNVMVAWRMPTFFKQFDIKAKKKLVDLHDAPVGHQDIPKEVIASVDLFMFKSKFQREIADHIPDEKCAIIPNGIRAEDFQLPFSVVRNPHRVIWASSYDRGLPTLLAMWKRVKEEVPEAELDIYYGWNTFDTFHTGNPEQMQWKWRTIREIADAGAKDHGRVSHKELAEAMLSAGVWAYPTHFPEIDCITATKAQAAGLTPITTGYGALQTTVLETEEDVTENGEKHIIYDMEKMKVFADRLINALKNPEPERQRIIRADKVIVERNWAAIAEKWSNAIGIS